MKNPISDHPEESVSAGTVRTKSVPSLRQEAEKRLAHLPARSRDLERKSPEEIVHELRVHQIELEMQNEELRETQRVLEESRDRYADLYDFSPVGYLTLTNKSVIVEANLTASILLGTDRQHLVRASLRKFVTDEDRDRWDRYFLNILKKPGKQVCEIRFANGTGPVLSARMESILLERESIHPVIRITMSDISDRVKAEAGLARKSHDFDELDAAYKTIASGQDELRHAVEELSHREGELRDALVEKDVLLAEIHHRVKNNLTAFISLLSMDGAYEDSPAGAALKKDLQNRARSMALVHETLYQTKKFSQVDMDIYLSTLANQVADSFPGSDAIRTVVEAKGVTLDITRATPCGLIINELVTNSLKYAFPESTGCRESRKAPCTIRVEMTSDRGVYYLAVSDNGIGLPAGIDPKTTQSLGLKLVYFLAKHQLRATIEIQRDQGTAFLFRFGKAAPE